MDNIFKISNESIIELVKKLIDKKPVKCHLYETTFQASKYVFPNIPNGISIEVSDGQECQYKFVHKKKKKFMLDNHKQKWDGLSIEATDDINIFVEAVINDECKAESVIQVPIEFWSYVGIIPWKFSISNTRQMKFPKYYISYGKKNEARTKCEISPSQHAELIALYKYTINEENRQKNINKQLIIDRQNAEILEHLLEANKIEKKLC